jgi:hypothetical protein
MANKNLQKIVSTRNPTWVSYFQNHKVEDKLKEVFDGRDFANQ